MNRCSAGNSRWTWPALWMALALIRGLLYAAVVPPWQAPDEPGHFEYAWHIARLGRLPAPGEILPEFEREQLGSLYAWHYGAFIGRPLPDRMPERISELPSSIFAQHSRTLPGGRFSLAYLWAAGFMAPLIHEDLSVLLYLARASSVILNAMVIALAWAIFREADLPEGWAVAATGFLVFWPQHTFINASVNEGPMAELWATLALWGWIRLFRRGLCPLGLGAIIGGTGLALWTKNTAAPLIPLSVVYAAAWGYRILRSKRQWGWKLTSGVTLAFLLFSAALLPFRTPVGRWVQGALRSLEPGNIGGEGLPPLDQIFRLTVESMWARFGWMNVSAGWFWYGVVYLLLVIALEGWMLPRSRRWRVPSWVIGVMGTFVAFTVAGWMFFVMNVPRGRYYAQGRYMFPAAVPLAFFLAGGWARWIPEGWEGARVFGFLLLWALLDAAAFAFALLPYFYKGG